MRDGHTNGDLSGLSEEWRYVMLVLDYAKVRIVYLYGPPGTGKTYAAFHYGRVEQGFYAITLTEETCAAELRGHFLLKGNDAFWHDGPFVRAMREGKRLVINEISNASADVLALLFPVLESFDTAELTLPTGETIRPAAGFHVVCTDNRPPDRLPEALQDRFMAILRVTKPHPGALAGLPPKLRSAAEKSSLLEDDRRVSARGWHALSLLLERFEPPDAYRIAFGPEKGQMLHQGMELSERRKSRGK